MRFCRLLNLGFIVLILATVIESCSQKDDSIAIAELKKSIIKSDSAINTSTIQIMTAFEQRLEEPGSRIKTEIWYPKSKKAQELSESFSEIIEQYRTHKRIGEY